MILFLGAGASRPLGVPTTTEFIELWVEAFGREDGSLLDIISTAFDGCYFDMEIAMTIVHDLARQTEEDFLSRVSPHTARFLLEQGLSLDFYRKHNEEASVLFRKLKLSIIDKCHSVLSQRESILRIYDQLFNALATAEFIRGTGVNRIEVSRDPTVLSPLPVSIFTLNYDNVIDIYMAQRKQQIEKGLVDRYGIRELNVGSQIEARTRGFEVAKLHGSVYLRISKTTGMVREWPNPLDEPEHVGDDGSPIGEHLMIYPVEYAGYEQIIQTPYLLWMYLFRQRLDTDEHKLWIVIGSSLRDTAVCSTMQDVLSRKPANEMPSVILADPSAGQIIKELSSRGFELLAERMECVEEPLGIDSQLYDRMKAALQRLRF
jgi:hypothetical protein